MTTPPVEVAPDQQVVEAMRAVNEYQGEDLRGLPPSMEDLGTFGANNDVRMWSNTPVPPVVMLYKTDTGDQVPILGYLLAEALRLEDPRTGQLRFSREPVEMPVREDLVCMLHEDHPKRDLWDRMGLPRCTKRGFLSPYEIRIHMQSKHKTANAVIAEHEAEVRQEYYDRMERDRVQTTVSLQNRLADAALGIPPVDGHPHSFKKYGYPTPAGAQCEFVDQRSNIRCPYIVPLEEPDPLES